MSHFGWQQDARADVGLAMLRLHVDEAQYALDQVDGTWDAEPLPEVRSVQQQNHPEWNVQQMRPVENLQASRELLRKAEKKIHALTSKHPPRRTNGCEQMNMTLRMTISDIPVGFAMPGIRPNSPGRIVSSHSTTVKLPELIMGSLTTSMPEINNQL
jgi:hypothetical protein